MTTAIRPYRIYELLGKISDGTFLNEKEFRELQKYITDLETFCVRFSSESTTPTQSKPR